MNRIKMTAKSLAYAWNLHLTAGKFLIFLYPIPNQTFLKMPERKALILFILTVHPLSFACGANRHR